MVVQRLYPKTKVFEKPQTVIDVNNRVFHKGNEHEKLKRIVQILTDVNRIKVGKCERRQQVHVIYFAHISGIRPPTKRYEYSTLAFN